MKIEIIKNNQPIKIFHDPKEVESCPDTKTIRIREPMGEIISQFKVKSKMLGWLQAASGKEEILVRIEVE
jgi:hypothetical protein